MMSNNAPNNDQPFSLQVATPSHRGNYCAHYVLAVVALQNLCLKSNVEFELKTTEGISNIDRARNMLASLFLQQSNASHMLFIDDDMGFTPDELFGMFEWRNHADVVAAMYPAKRIDWERIKRIIIANPDIETAHLPNLASSYTGMWKQAEQGPIPAGTAPVPVDAIGTGLMMISRQCLLRLTRQANIPVIAKDEVTGLPIYEFFRSRIRDGMAQGEDYYFCELVRRNGGTVLGYPGVTTTHTGKHSYVGDLSGLAKYLPE